MTLSQRPEWWHSRWRLLCKQQTLAWFSALHVVPTVPPGKIPQHTARSKAWVWSQKQQKKSHQNQNLVPAVYDIIDSLSWWNILCFPLFQLRVPLGLFNGCIAVKEELEKTDGLLFIFLFVLVKCYSWLSTQMLLPAVLGRPCGVGSQIQA